MSMLTVLLNLPGSPVPDWLVFLAPLALLIIIVKTGKWLKQWVRNYVIPKFFSKKNKQAEEAGDEAMPFSYS